jgi:hypothetical protein
VALAAAGFAFGAASWALADVIYRWVDKQGKTHFSDTVPNEYKSVAKPLGNQAPVPSPAEQRQAMERVAEQKRQLTALGAPAPGASAAASAPAGAAASPLLLMAPIKRPTHAPNEDANCETWRRLYQESLDCFGPYTTVRGGITAEAFEACTLVKEPPSRCR